MIFAEKSRMLQKSRIIEPVAPKMIADVITNGPPNEVHKLGDIESMLHNCDALNFVTFKAPRSGLDLLSFAHLSLHSIPSNLDKKYEDGMFLVLRQIEQFEQFGVFDDVLMVIAGYMAPCTFTLEHGFDHYPKTYWNDSYFCNILSISLARNFIAVHIDENGDMSAGRLQAPTYSKLRRNQRSKGVDPSYTSFSHFDLKERIIGVMTYKISDLYKWTVNDILSLTFRYGSSGYNWAQLFDAGKSVHREFIAEFLQYHQ